jgi:hypothetical protein
MSNFTATYGTIDDEEAVNVAPAFRHPLSQSGVPAGARTDERGPRCAGPRADRVATAAERVA